MTPVGVAVRFVPSGIVRDSRKMALRGTLLLSPISGPLAGSCGRAVDLEKWPSAIEELLTCAPGIEVLVEPVTAQGAGDRAAPPKAGDRPALTLAADALHRFGVSEAALRKQHVDKLDKKWADLITAAGVEWVDLCSVLENGDPNGTLAASAAQQDVLATGGGQMSLLLALERAQSLLSRIRAPEDEGPGSCVRAGFETGAEALDRPTERLRTRASDSSQDRSTNMPWLASAPKLLDQGFPGTPQNDQEDRRRERAEAARRSALTEKLLGDDRASADGQAKARSDYVGGTSGPAVAAGLDAMAEARPACDSPADAVACAAAPAGAGLQGSLDRARTQYYAGTRPDIRPATSKMPTEQTLSAQQNALHRLFALQSQPALARVFNLAIDVIIPLSDEHIATLAAAHGCAERVHGTLSADARFAFVAARPAANVARRTIWTTSKLRLPWDKLDTLPDDVLLFWACTREELDARSIGWSQAELLDKAVAAQIDGMVDLGAGRSQGTGDKARRNPRFDLATLDPRRATEMDLHSDALASRRGGMTAVGTMPSGGLLLIDRWRQFHAVAKATDRQAARQPPSDDAPIVADAEALTIGFRLDVGSRRLAVRSGGRWSSAAYATISTRVLDDALRLLVPDQAERLALDAASMTLTTRSLKDPNPANPPTSFAEEIVVQWPGPPLGVDLHGLDAVAGATQYGDGARSSILALSQEFSLPQDSPDCPPRQCFGWPVRVAVRPQLEGGVVKPLRDAIAAYKSFPDHRFTLPPAAPGVRGRRILRHERIEHPLVTTPLEVLRRPGGRPAGDRRRTGGPHSPEPGRGASAA